MGGSDLEDIDSIKGLKRPALWFAVLDISISTLLDPFTYVDGSSIDTEINKASFSRTHLSYETDGLKNTVWFADRVVNIPSSVRL